LVDQLTSRVVEGSLVDAQYSPDLEGELERFLADKCSPGDPLPSERELSHLFDASRHSVRIALQHLATRGVITTRPGARSRVNTPSQAAAIAGQFLRRSHATIDELYEARMVVEAGAAALLARRVGLGSLELADFDELGAILDELDALAAEKVVRRQSPDFALMMRRRDLDLRFHLGLVELVGNHITSGAEHSVLTPFQSYPTLWNERDVAVTSQAEHRAILASVLAGDASTAALQVIRHFEKGENRLSHILKREPRKASAKRPTGAG
jgi:DNA-binding FadR family transcriptional regulator